MAKAKPKPQPKSKSKPKLKTQQRALARSQAGADPAIEALTKGLAALQKKDWQKASDLLEKAVKLADLPELRERARQFLAACRQKAQAEDAKPAKGVDPYLQAVYEKNRGNLKEALEISRRGGRDQKDERFAYLAASIHAIENRMEEAAQALAKAVELNSKNRIHAFHDSDFAELRKNRDYRSLFGLS